MKKINNFEGYGFKADFRGEILREVNNMFIGYIIQDGCIFPAMWAKNGIEESIRHSEFNLTPIKKEWYEREENFPCIMFNEKTKYFFVLNNISAWISCFKNASSYRPATQEEINSLIIK